VCYSNLIGLSLVFAELMARNGDLYVNGASLLLTLSFSFMTGAHAVECAEDALSFSFLGKVRGLVTEDLSVKNEVMVCG
jgi:hypothetical protein